VVEKNGWVYLNTYSGLNKIDNVTGNPFVETFFVEEEIARNDSVVFLNMDFNCYSRILSENSLDVMHIGFVHTFGNAKRPAPAEQHPPRLVGPYHYKTSYLYEAGDESIARKAFGYKELRIENEFILPHTTVARVMFGDLVSTVITFALPITETKSKLFVKTYRNFWNNPLGDMVTENMMYKTMLQDKLIVENIDMRYMDGKFNMRFDKLQNTYKSFYKRFVHNYSEQNNNDIKDLE
jgi:phenylpropionate dioxygenase-like ring-hydroxylating dioxygenase large terminal subunit